MNGTVTSLAAWRTTRHETAIRTPDDLVAAVGVPFSDEQLAAITAPLEPTVVIAGAGSGKTTVMAARVVWLVGTGQVRPGQVLGLTFTRKAAAELAQRIRTALVTSGVLSPDSVDDEGEQVILTYDSFASRLVSEHGLWLGYETDPTMITGAARYRLASRVVAAAAGPFEELSRLRPESVTERVLALDSQLTSHLVDDALLDEQTRAFVLELANAPTWRGNVYQSVRRAEAAARERLELASLVRSYAELKRRLGYVEFSDQMAAAARIATRVPQVACQLRDQYRVVLLDEYQDTSAAQALLLKGLFSGEDADEGRGHPVTGVGDPFQAIYGWRGAAASNILAFPTDFPLDDGRPAPVLPLTINRRSGPRILDVANELAAPLRADETIAYDLGRRLLRAPEGTAPGQVETKAFSTWPEEVDWVVDRVVAARETEVAAWNEIAVLARRNADIGPVYSALLDRDVPAEIVGLGGLLTLPEVADVVSTLRLVDDVAANPDLVRLLTGPRWAIGAGDVELLGRRARELARTRSPWADRDGSLEADLSAALADTDPSESASLAEALTDLGDWPFSDEARERFTALGDELAMLRRHAAEPVGDLVRRVVSTLGVEVELAAVRGPGATAQLDAFLDAVADFTTVDADATVRGLLAYLDAELEHGTGLDQALPSAADSVKLLTIHRAKGLEWDVVVLPALCDKTFPSDRVTDNWVRAAHALPAELRGDAASVAQLEDASDAGFKAYDEALRLENRRSEDRLAYVAVTRARRLLVASTHAWRAGDVRRRAPSPYFLTLGGDATPTFEHDANPLSVALRAVPWPTPLDPDQAARRRGAAGMVTRLRKASTDAEAASREVSALVGAAPAEVSARLAAWDSDVAMLLAEARDGRRRTVEVTLPESLTASQVMLGVADPDDLAARLARPMPRPPSRSGRFGTRFHEWVLRHFASPTLIDPDDLREVEDDTPDAELREMCRAFAEGRFGEVLPAVCEFPFSLLVGTEVVRGRIDAAYGPSPVTPAGFDALVVDWKTGSAPPDPLQLALYRLAWAELNDLDVAQVAAGFYHVRDDRLELVENLPGRTDIEALVAGLGH
ncbi:MAG TPA: ATP-dependent DNA helicase [Propionibacteriaceae bacterium]|nr:ATP-dependent DNA helicase [Propionibacteriaceae bacterium]